MAGRGRVVALTNGAVAAALVVALAAVALVVRPPAPPGISEFAPQASKPITKAPLGQAAQHGAGTGACADEQVCATSPTTPAPAAVPVSRDPGKGAPPGLQCYGWPDGKVTQTEDPQSPPCIATWDYEKGNGGATSRGVTGSTITVLVPWLKTDYRLDAQIQDLQTFFNRRFQLYGRQLRLVAPTARLRCSGPDTERAAAAGAVAQKVFASTEIAGCEGSGGYPRALASRQVIAVSHTSAELTRRDQVRGAPYLWSYAPAFDAVQQHSAQFACKNLKGTASYGGPGVGTRQRSFVVLRHEQSDTDLSVLREGMAGCFGAAPPVKEYTAPQCGQQLQQEMLKLSQAGVTTLIAVDELLDCPQNAADAVGYQPEWFVVPTEFLSFQESTLSATSGHPASQMGHAFGLMPLNKLLTPQQEPAFRAIGSINPAHLADVTPLFARSIYEQLLVLASGIQMAGPRLTPATFASGLEQADFANPGAGARPSYQAHVGFGSDDHAMVDDLGVWWWSSSSETVDGGPGGGFCYAERGRRWALGQWPSTIRLQQQESCR